MSGVILLLFVGLMLSIKLYFDYVDNQIYKQVPLQVSQEAEYYNALSHRSHVHKNIPTNRYRHHHHYVR